MRVYGAGTSFIRKPESRRLCPKNQSAHPIFCRDYGRRCQHPVLVTKLCIFAGTTLGGYAGWYLGEACGLEFLGAFLLSGLGSLAGVYGGWKLARKFEE